MEKETEQASLNYFDIVSKLACSVEYDYFSS